MMELLLQAASLVATATAAVALLAWLAVYVIKTRVFPVQTGRAAPSPAHRELVVGLFHPYCHSGGGGERVLWVGLKALAAESSTDDMPTRFVVYTGDVGVKASDIFRRVRERFGITFAATDNIEFVYLNRRHLVEASTWPRFTMLGQSLGSMLLAWEALRKRRPHIFIDTTGYAFTYPVARLAHCKVACYTHYPTITADMLNKVYERRPTYNNDAEVAQSALKTAAKAYYYRLFAKLYSLAGRCVDVVMVNSGWTAGHIASLWDGKASPRVVFPPCNTKDLMALPLGGRKRTILSVGQFRGEKDHRLQLESFAALRKLGTEYRDVRLILLGGCRGAEDEALVEGLRARAKQLRLPESHVDFKVNAPFDDLRALLGSSLLGIHTMWNEHFGIGVVEMMAAGTVVVAHNSGGPMTDIVVPFDEHRTGFLASTAAGYAAAMARVLDAAPSGAAAGSAGAGAGDGDGDGDDSDGAAEAEAEADAEGDGAGASAGATRGKKPGASPAKKGEPDYVGGDDESDGGELDLLGIADAARASVHRFSDEEFSLQFYGAVVKLLHQSAMEISGVVAEGE